MKTAMQEFIEKNFYVDTEGEYHLKWTEDTPMNDELNEALEKEKEQIIAAREDGNMFYLFKTNEQYLNQTYKQTK